MTVLVVQRHSNYKNPMKGNSANTVIYLQTFGIVVFIMLPIQIFPSVLRTVAPLPALPLTVSASSTTSVAILRLRVRRTVCQRSSAMLICRTGRLSCYT